jgi:hypothetical protein
MEVAGKSIFISGGNRQSGSDLKRWKLCSLACEATCLVGSADR